MFLPNTNAEVSQFLRSRSKSPLHISGNKNESNNVEMLSLSNLNSVLLYEPEEMIISVQSGISLESLERVLNEKGQWIPALVANESNEKTLGAAVAMDHYHPRAKTFGMLRTTILGGTFCTTKGEIFKSGSRVVKSVAGYDIHRAFCGSKGLFGVILSLTLKVQPKPEMFFHFLADLKDKDRLLRFQPACLEIMDGKFFVELAGYTEDIEDDIRNLRRDISFEAISDSKWNEFIRKLSSQKVDSSLEHETSNLLNEVRKVFDPEGVLL